MPFEVFGLIFMSDGIERRLALHLCLQLQEKDGFGHLAVAVDDVYEACKMLEEQGMAFKKKPDEGRMKGLAFVYDPGRLPQMPSWK